MNVMNDIDMDAPTAPDPNMGLDVELEPVVESPEEEEEELPWGNDPATATWAPMMAEVNSTLYFPDTILTWPPTRSLARTGDVPRP
jgi:hypothetical protein